MKVIGEGTTRLSQTGKRGWKTKWGYIATAGVLRAILPQILPFLIIKRVTSEKMCEYFKFGDENPTRGLKEIPSGYHERLDSLYLAVKRLNKKGK